ncbi:hypothetical protein OAQ46_07070 [Gammaproteobacteria bacterium]|jgi:hypothetical protein|nr:hypothetical protein [Gammaproteobacteria bacterium]|tara:strand:+ start:36 stop:179 length:144 start_codon:yes stop_codon:yes gene_type:complete
MEGIESSAEENKGMPEIKMSEDLLHAKKEGLKPLFKRLTILGFLARN